MELRDWLREEIASRHLEQKDVAGAVGLDQDRFSKVMRGIRGLSGDELAAALRYFGYPVPWDRSPPPLREPELPAEVAKIARLASLLDMPRRRALGKFLRVLVQPS